MSKRLSETKVMITNARLSYAHLFEPRSVSGGPAKYSVSILIDKSDTETVEMVKKAIQAAKEAGAAKLGGAKSVRLPLRDGDVDRPEDEVYAGCYFLNANSASAPQVVALHKDAAGKTVHLGPDDVYSGCYANVTVNFYAYNASMNKGIAAGLGNVQKVADGDRLGGGSRAEDDFDFEDAQVSDDWMA